MMANRLRKRRNASKAATGARSAQGSAEEATSSRAKGFMATVCGLAVAAAGSAITIALTDSAPVIKNAFSDELKIHASVTGLDDWWAGATEKKVDPTVGIHLKDEIYHNGPNATLAGRQVVKVVIESGLTSSVTVVGMQAKILRRSPVLSGSLFEVPGQGTAENVQVGIRLDSPLPIARRLKEGNTLQDLTSSYFEEMSEPLKKGAPTVFTIIAFPGRFTYEWELEVEVVSSGVSHIHRIRESDAGKPFKVTGFAPKYSSTFTWNHGRTDEDPWWIHSGTKGRKSPA
ncbi:hypothetical protein Nocox_05705 [Nonomuraea coxensis DSM 45129]|uniref:Uncharacterized protein n=2 Tax=Nonomuraea coxensis TaxID=404386 RepID=A0ABX8TUF0_9ACTN|nr:hypothetical protein Nocox_05705 [Nonomuraea coxensis DSM 45129]